MVNLAPLQLLIWKKPKIKGLRKFKEKGQKSKPNESNGWNIKIKQHNEFFKALGKNVSLLLCWWSMQLAWQHNNIQTVLWAKYDIKYHTPFKKT